MTCQEIKILILKYITGESNKEESDTLINHLLECRNCKKEFADYQKIQEILKRYPEIFPDEEIKYKILSSIDAKEEKKIFHVLPKYLYRFALGIILFFIVILGYERISLDISLRKLKTSVSILENTNGSKINILLEHFLIDELSKEKIDYLTIANIQNAIFLSDNIKVKKDKVVLILKEILKNNTKLRLFNLLEGIFGYNFAEASIYGNFQEQALFDSGYSLEKAQRFDEAIEIYKTIADSNDKYISEMAKILLNYAKEEKKLFNRLSKVSNIEDKIKLRLKSLDFKGVIEEYQKLNIKSQRLKFISGICYEKNGINDEAVKVFEELLNSDKVNKLFNIAVETNLGIVYHKMGFKDKAFKHFQNVQSSGLIKNMDLSLYYDFIKYLFRMGEIPNDKNGCKVTVSQDKLTFKIEVKKNKWWVGEIYPRVSIWDGYDYLKFDIFNPEKEPILLGFTLKPYPNVSWSDRFDCPILLKPGKNTIEIPLNGAVTNDKSKLIDWKKKIYMWNINNSFKAKVNLIYISNIRLEKAR